MKNIVIILHARLPVPAVQGGAIKSTIQLLIDKNKIYDKFHITLFLTFDKKAKELSAKYGYTEFVWIKRGSLYEFINFFIRGIRKIFFKGFDLLDSQIIKWHVKRLNIDKIIVHGNVNHLLALSKVVEKEKFNLKKVVVKV